MGEARAAGRAAALPLALDTPAASAMSPLPEYVMGPGQGLAILALAQGRGGSRGAGAARSILEMTETNIRDDGGALTRSSLAMHGGAGGTAQRLQRTVRVPATSIIK